MDDIDIMFDDHPSLAASSIGDIESDREQSPFFGIPSTHSGFKSEESEVESDMSPGPWSPPAWRKSGSGWYPKHHLQPFEQSRQSSPVKSRESSPRYESAQEEDTTLPAMVPLPASPLKQSPRNSPEREIDREETPLEQPAPEQEKEATPAPVESSNNYIRFAVRAEVQQRTDTIESVIDYFRDTYKSITSSRMRTFVSILVALCSLVIFRVLFQPPQAEAVPDLIKVARLAKTFEPLIHYSENGIDQIGDLQETGVAVWDLGETVRSTNMTSAPIIVKALDDLSDSLKKLGNTLTSFFINVNGDVDSILMAMEFAERNLARVGSMPTGAVTVVFANIHTIMTTFGLLEYEDGSLTTVGKVVKELFGQTRQQMTQRALQKAFNDILQTLEESINNELTQAAMLFALFETIDQQFLNLQRAVLREWDEQERAEGDMLTSLWTKLIGPNASELRKFERNKQLLASVKDKTLKNKHLLVEHNGRLVHLKSNLEMLRKKLVSPLVRSNESSTLSMEEQIDGLRGTYQHLRDVREIQKDRVMERLYHPKKSQGGERAYIGEGHA
ncbi:hypothetical protein M501DRAFT_928004 [Patellaria atrata CBS 101060]|uniref:Uncharacterized protein n=1 Tax=Patellaria atrata CBS 101060 TaxID=1346257 RepID=A0A9P4VTS7_9PEZI|nr:hypothetical protein M501DRAFT_928004 [Patellaria atrata CBS 101060]